MVMELLVVIIIIVLFAFLRPRLSMDRPGKLQHIFEIIRDFVRGESEDAVGHGGSKYLPFFGTLFIFILICNLIGIIPGFESPTINPSVPAGCALATFCYYNLMGFREQGIGKYLAHFAGPMPFLAPLMVPIELISHMARPLSLTVRLYANMYAGEQVTLVFLSLTYFLVPAVFMGLHVFRFPVAGLHLYAAHDDVRSRSSIARALINGFMPPLQCETGCTRMTGTTSWGRFLKLEGARQ